MRLTISIPDNDPRFDGLRAALAETMGSRSRMLAELALHAYIGWGLERTRHGPHVAQQERLEGSRMGGSGQQVAEPSRPLEDTSLLADDELL